MQFHFHEDCQTLFVGRPVYQMRGKLVDCVQQEMMKLPDDRLDDDDAVATIMQRVMPAAPVFALDPQPQVIEHPVDHRRLYGVGLSRDVIGLRVRLFLRCTGAGEVLSLSVPSGLPPFVAHQDASNNLVFDICCLDPTPSAVAAVYQRWRHLLQANLDAVTPYWTTLTEEVTAFAESERVSRSNRMAQRDALTRDLMHSLLAS